MPHVTNEADILEQLERSLETTPAELETRVLSASQRGPSLWARITAMLKPSARRERYLISQSSQAEMSLDILAREHPYLYMRAMIG